MRKQLIFLFLLLIVSDITKGQGIFEKSYGVDINPEFGFISNLTQLPDSGYVFSVVSYHNQNNSLLIGRIDKFGQTVWVNQIDESYNIYQANFDISPTGFIHLTFTAYKENPTEFYPVVVKFDLSGNVIWSKGYSENVARDASSEQIFVGNDCIYIAGELRSPPPSDLFLFKTDTVGNFIWGITYDTERHDYLRDAALLDNGDILLSGIVEDSSFHNHGTLVRVNPNGNIVWNKRFHTSLFKPINMQAIKELDDGNIMLSGHADSISSQVGFGLWDMCLMKVSANGDFQWGKIYGGEDYDEFWEVMPTDDGGFMLAAEPESFGNVSRIGLMKVDNVGEFEWLKLYGQASGGFPNSTVKTSDNGFTILASNGSHNESRSMLLMKMDAFGNSFCDNTSVSLPSTSFIPTWENYGTVNAFTGSGIYAPVVNDYPLNASDRCKPSDVTIEFLENNFHVYPNPTVGQITIKLQTDKVVDYSYFIQDIHGLVISQSTNIKTGNFFESTIDLTGLNSGVYLLEVNAGDQQFRQKILKK